MDRYGSSKTQGSKYTELYKKTDKIIVFAPTVEAIYNGNTISEQFDFDGLEFEMEGKFREGHFNGVGTIVKRLLEIIQPDKAYFGEKDFQQLQIIKKLAKKKRKINLAQLREGESTQTLSCLRRENLTYLG